MTDPAKALAEYSDGTNALRCTNACAAFQSNHARDVFHSCRLPAGHAGEHLHDCILAAHGNVTKVALDAIATLEQTQPEVAEVLRKRMGG